MPWRILHPVKNSCAPSRWTVSAAIRVPSRHVLQVDQRHVTLPLPGLCRPILVFHSAPAPMFLLVGCHSVRRSGPCLDFETGNPRYPNITGPLRFSAFLPL